MQVWFPERTLLLPSWARIAFGSFAVVFGLLTFVLAFHNFDWVSLICLGCWFLLCYPVPHRGASSAREYLMNPRVVGSFILLSGVLVGGLVSLWLTASKW